MSAAEMLAEWGAATGGVHRDIELWQRLVHEEAIEVREALDRVELAKELADLVYVAYGAAQAAGIDLDHALELVHLSNLTKVDQETGEVTRRADGKILKGPHYRPPNMREAVRAA